MPNKTIKRLLLVLIVLFFLSTACGIPIAPMADSTATSEPTSNLATDLPTSPPVQAPTETAKPHITTLPTQESPTITPTLSGSISSGNASSLTPLDPFTIPEWPERILWPGSSVSIPGDPSPRPHLLSNSGPSLYPVAFDPPGISSPIPLPLNGNQILAFAPDASSLVVQDPSQSGVYTMQGQQLWLITNPQQPYGASYSSDGRFLAVTSSQDWAVTVYDVASGQEIITLTGFETAAPVYSAIIAPGGKTLTYFARATLRFQNVETGQLGAEINFEDFIGPILYSPDGQRLVVYAAGKLMIYNPATGEQLANVTLSDALQALVISPDGSALVGIYGQRLQFWDGSTLAPIATIQPPTSLAQISVSPDGQYLVTLSGENQLTIWHIP